MDKCRVCQEFFASNEGLCSSCFRRERPEAAAALAAALNERPDNVWVREFEAQVFPEARNLEKLRDRLEDDFKEKKEFQSHCDRTVGKWLVKAVSERRAPIVEALLNIFSASLQRGGGGGGGDHEPVLQQAWSFLCSRGSSLEQSEPVLEIFLRNELMRQNFVMKRHYEELIYNGNPIPWLERLQRDDAKDLLHFTKGTVDAAKYLGSRVNGGQSDKSRAVVAIVESAFKEQTKKRAEERKREREQEEQVAEAVAEEPVKKVRPKRGANK